VEKTMYLAVDLKGMKGRAKVNEKGSYYLLRGYKEILAR